MMRLICALVLSLMLGLTSVTMAVARAQAPAVSQITICSGYGVVTLSVDAEGNPTGGVHHCPLCVLGMGLAVLPVTPGPVRPSTRGEALVWPLVRYNLAQPLRVPQARGPPGLI